MSASDVMMGPDNSGGSVVANWGFSRILQQSTSLEQPSPTPWGPAGAVILCLLPIAFLVTVTVVKQLLLPTSISLPAAAALLAFIRLAYLSSSPVQVAACCVSGMLEALTPLSIITGAIMLFQAMHHTKCLPWMMGQIKSLSAGHPVAEVFLIGYCFAYLVEGASGFGTPVALAAPMLASLGHDPLNTVVCLLIMNTLATQFGAVGTPVWFGFGDIGLGEANLQLTGLKASIIVGVSAFVIAPLAAAFLVPFKDLARNIVFVVLSTASAVVPALMVSLFSYEFPSLIGGLASVLLTGLLVRFKVGLRPVSHKTPATTSTAAAVDKDSDVENVATDSRILHQRSLSKRLKWLSSGSNRLKRTTSDTYSFVEDLGAVIHPPVATLDFPLTNAPVSYPAARCNSFAAQVDEDTIKAELVAGDTINTNGRPHVDAAHNPHINNTGCKQPATDSTEAVNKRAYGKSSDAAPDVHFADIERGGVSSSSGRMGVGEVLKDCNYKSKNQADDLPLRRTRSGDMEINPLDPNVAVTTRMTLQDLVLRTLPIWLTVLVLLLTRIPAIPLKRVLQSQDPNFTWDLGTFGNFGISASLVIFLKEIMTDPAVNWKYELLYVPFLLPFALASIITMLVHRKDLEVKLVQPFKDAFQRVAGITVATLGALVLVQLIRVGGRGSPAFIIGYYFSTWLREGFLAISAFLGALGSFFSGSTTVSNLTFGDIQKIAAEKIGAEVTGMLAVQVAGATAGNMICINNILSAKAVMNMNHIGEGEFIRRTAPVALLFCIMAQCIGLIFTLGGLMPDKPITASS